MTLEKKILYTLGMILVTLQGILEFMKHNQLSKVETGVQEVATDVGEEAIKTRKEVRKSEADVIEEAEAVATDLVPSVDDLKAKIAAMGQGPQPSRGLLDKVISPEERAMMHKAGVDAGRTADAAEAIQAAVELISQRLVEQEPPLQPTAAPQEYAPDPEPQAEGGPPQEPTPPQGPWRPTMRQP